MFGSSADLCIYDKKSGKKSFCSFYKDNYTYEMPPGCKSEEEAIKYFAGGSMYFTIKEIEVFRVSFK